MALKDKIPFGMVLPHRSMDPLKLSDIRDVAQRAEALCQRRSESRLNLAV